MVSFEWRANGFDKVPGVMLSYIVTQLQRSNGTLDEGTQQRVVDDTFLRPEELDVTPGQLYISLGYHVKETTVGR